MSLIDFDSINDSLIRNRCVLSQEPLSGDEYLVSRKRLPGAYTGSMNASEQNVCVSIIETLTREKRRVEGLPSNLKSEVRNFFSQICAEKTDIIERFIESYVYIFWQELNIGLITTGDIEIFLTNQGSIRHNEELDQKLIGVPSVINKFVADARVDLIGLEVDSGIIYSIEIKRGELDDRSIGQTLRYFRAQSDILYRLDRSVNINSIRPVLIVRRARAKYWLSFPDYFRELLIILEFNVDFRTREITFTDPKRRILSELYDIRTRRER